MSFWIHTYPTTHPIPLRVSHLVSISCPRTGADQIGIVAALGHCQPWAPDACPSAFHMLGACLEVRSLVRPAGLPATRSRQRTHTLPCLLHACSNASPLAACRASHIVRAAGDRKYVADREPPRPSVWKRPCRALEMSTAASYSDQTRRSGCMPDLFLVRGGWGMIAQQRAMMKGPMQRSAHSPPQGGLPNTTAFFATLLNRALITSKMSPSIHQILFATPYTSALCLPHSITLGSFSTAKI